jgi:hypothetical protein
MLCRHELAGDSSTNSGLRGFCVTVCGVLVEPLTVAIHDVPAGSITDPYHARLVSLLGNTRPPFRAGAS